MKTKLLKKIRKRFSVNYYPNRDDGRCYHLTDRKDTSFCYHLIKGTYWNTTKQRCLDTMMELINLEYYKYSKEHKLSNMHTKVWHNAKPLATNQN